MKRNNNNHNIHASSVNDMPDIEIVDLKKSLRAKSLRPLPVSGAF